MKNSRRKLVLFVFVLAAVATAVAAGGGACQRTSQDGLNACKATAQSTYLNSSGTCANLSQSQARQVCYQTAKATYQSDLSTCQAQFATRQQVCQKVGSGPYDPPIDPANFTNVIDNQYFPQTPGKTYVYEGPTSQGYIQNTTTVTSNTKVIDGVTTVEVHDSVFTDSALTEDTLDWYAQDLQGNVWYFGEDSDELIDGRVSSLGGSWTGGVNGAKPGIVMLAQPAVGNFYRQEFLLNTAEDSAGVIALDQTVTVPAGTFQHCVETEEFTGLEPGALEHKYYAPGVGTVLTVDLVTGDTFPLVQIK
jgi:hypothetical protein